MARPVPEEDREETKRLTSGSSSSSKSSSRPEGRRQKQKEGRTKSLRSAVEEERMLEERRERRREERERLRELRRGAARERLGWQGALTGGADLAWTMGAAAAAVVVNKTKAKEGRDIHWALGEILIGSVVAMSLAETTPVLAQGDDRIGTAPTLLNMSLGVAVAGLTYILVK